MGDYTELRMRAIVKPEYRPIFARVFDDPWPRWCDVAPDFPDVAWLQSWALYDRSSFIPFGCSAYFDPDPAWDLTFSSESGFMQFQCNLKNYHDTIGEFLRVVAPAAFERVIEAWYHYEYDDPRRIDHEGVAVSP